MHITPSAASVDGWRIPEGRRAMSFLTAEMLFSSDSSWFLWLYTYDQEDRDNIWDWLDTLHYEDWRYFEIQAMLSSVHVHGLRMLGSLKRRYGDKRLNQDGVVEVLQTELPGGYSIMGVLGIYFPAQLSAFLQKLDEEHRNTLLGSHCKVIGSASVLSPMTSLHGTERCHTIGRIVGREISQQIFGIFTGHRYL
jgi:hypothetical protein